MQKLSAKNKIFLTIALGLLLSVSMFFYFFNFLDNSNLATLAEISQQRKDLALLKAERDSYVQAQSDIKKMSEQTYQPDQIFSKDVSLVKEIETLEEWSDTLKVKMQLGGVSGTINTLPKAKTSTPLGVVSYSLGISGSYLQVINFIEVMENLDFISNINSVSLAASGGAVSANLTANFYLKK